VQYTLSLHDALPISPKDFRELAIDPLIGIIV